jgi:hypothetical protein
VIYSKSQVPTEWFNRNGQIDLIDMLAIHGGISYKNIYGDYVIFGFDCNHAGDNENSKLKDKNYIIELINQMEQQIDLHIKRLPEFRKLKTKKQKTNLLIYLKNLLKEKLRECRLFILLPKSNL